MLTKLVKVRSIKPSAQHCVNEDESHGRKCCCSGDRASSLKDLLWSQIITLIALCSSGAEAIPCSAACQVLAMNLDPDQLFNEYVSDGLRERGSEYH